MEKKTDGISDFSIEQAMRLAESDTGKQLLALLQAQNSDRLQQAAALASQGDFSAAKQTLSGFLSSPEAVELLQKLQR